VSINHVDSYILGKATELSATHKKSTPEQVAGLVSFLLSPAADNMTGK
jgi:enoyl-[acyl-carrier-protein] reductase (NADH)